MNDQTPAPPATLRDLATMIPAAAWSPTCRLLHRIAHDLNGTVATIMMESYSSRMIVERLRGVAEPGPVELDQLDAICTNLEVCGKEFRAFIEALTALTTPNSGET